MFQRREICTGFPACASQGCFFEQSLFKANSTDRGRDRSTPEKRQRAQIAMHKQVLEIQRQGTEDGCPRIPRG